MNLLMAALYDGFIKNRQGIKAHKQDEDNEENLKNDEPIIVRKLSPQLRSIISVKEDKKSKEMSKELDLDSSPMIKRILQKPLKKRSMKSFDNFKPCVNYDYHNFTIDYKMKAATGKLFSIIISVMNSKKFNLFICICLLINIIVLAMDRAYISEEDLYYLEIINFVCTLIFFFEIAARMAILGLRNFWKNHFDKLDLIIILLNMGDIIFLAVSGNDFFLYHTSYSSVIKCLKTLRIFRFIAGLKYWKRGTILFIEMVYALAQTKEFVVLIIILVFIGSLSGMELFAYKIRFTSNDKIPTNLADGLAPRINFDNIGDALLATTLICLNEEWHIYMYQHMRILGYDAAWYFIIVLLVGEVLLIRMFMALFINAVIQSENIKNLIKVDSNLGKLIKSFFNLSKREILKKKILSFFKIKEKNDQNSEDFKENREMKLNTNLEGYPPPIQDLNQNVCKTLPNLNKRNYFASMSFQVSRNYENILNLTKCLKQNESNILNKNAKIGFLKWYRSICQKIVRHKYFEKIILLTILISVVFLMMNNPFEPTDSFLNKLQFIIDIIVLIFYFMEMALKISAFGFIMGEKPFILDPWNCFDIFLFVLTFLGTLDTKTDFAGVSFKWCRVFRIFKIIQFNKGLKDAFNTLFKSIPDLISLLFYYFIDLLFFGLIAVKYLKGNLYYCTTVSDESKNFIFTKEDCFDYGGDWINKDLNFDNIFQAISSLIQISTTEGWLEEMYNGMDYVGNNQNIMKNNKKTMAIFYVSFFIVSNLIVINMFIGMLVQTYLHQKNLNCNIFILFFINLIISTFCKFNRRAKRMGIYQRKYLQNETKKSSTTARTIYQKKMFSDY